MERTRAPTERAAPPRRRRRAASSPATPPGTLEDVRRILVGAERERLDAIEAQQPVISAESVGAVLPDAAVEASRHHRHELSVALEPTLTTTIRQVVERDSELFGAILSPAIGAAVRRAVREAFDALVQRIDETLAFSLSPESIAWRIEARRTGRPLAEIVLARTLLYRVEQVFLIHSPSGVALRHVAVPGVGAANPDQVASMLSAIDAFVVEAFSGGEPAAHVGRFEAGGLTVWVDRDPLATIAAVVRGRGPSELGDMLCHARERISVSQRPELERFVSEVELFAPSEPVLEECLVSRTTPPSKRPRRVLGAVLALVALAALGALGAWQWRRASDARQLARSVAALEAEPGIVVLSASGSRRPSIRSRRAPSTCSRDGTCEPASSRSSPSTRDTPRSPSSACARRCARPTRSISRSSAASSRWLAKRLPRGSSALGSRARSCPT